MPTELEDLVGFLHHGNTPIRQTAAANLVGYSHSKPSIFRINQLEPIRDLKMLVKDYTPISKNALTMLINLTEDREVLKALATDDAFLETLILRITNQKEPNADEIAMLLANLAKAEETLRLLKLKRAVPKSLSTSPFAIDQLLDCFVKGAKGTYNKHANYDYLSYFFADLAKFPECRTYFTQPQAHDADIIPLTKLTPFTEDASPIRRRGVIFSIKNCAFDVPAHPALLDSSTVNILPYILLPLMGGEEYSEEESDKMLEDLQLLPGDKQRETDAEILKTELETLLLLTTTKEGRGVLRAAGSYYVVRECHLHVEDEDVREACDRFVQVIMSDEEGEGKSEGGGSGGPGESAMGAMVTEILEEDEDEQIIDIM